MTDNIKSIFHTNIKLIGEMDKAVINFRELEYDKALGIVADSVEQIKYILNEIIINREYFNLVTTDAVVNMLSGILEANKNKDFILLTDLLELQLISFLESVQELIICKESMEFDEQHYKENIKAVIELGAGFAEEIGKLPDSARLLELGYRVEFTTEGQMTLVACQEGLPFYFHTNSHVQREAFLLARRWLAKGCKGYIVYGLGMGYHIQELHQLEPKATIEVYEADPNVIQLACAFADIKSLLSNSNIKLIYDPDYQLVKARIQGKDPEMAFRIHYPSMRKIQDKNTRKMMEKYLPWSKTINLC